MTATQPHADPSAVQRRVNKVARDVTALLATVEQLTAERDRAREIAKALEREHSWKDEALAELRALVDEWYTRAQSGNSPERYDVGWLNAKRACAIHVARILDALAARIDAHLFPTDGRENQ